MKNYQLHDENTAPAGAQPTLTQVKSSYGFIPNLHAVMAESPSLLKAYTTISRVFEETSFTHTEKQLILLEICQENGCDYSVEAHSTVAQMKKVPAEIIEALRDGRSLPDKNLEALRQFVRTMVVHRGHATEADIEAFLAAGYTRAQLFDVLVGVGMKTLSNYTNHLANTPLDTAFQSQVWKKAG